MVLKIENLLKRNLQKRLFKTRSAIKPGSLNEINYIKKKRIKNWFIKKKRLKKTQKK